MTSNGPSEQSRGRTADDLEYVVCNLCGADRPKTVLETKDYRYPSADVFRITRCGQCGHMYLNPRPTAAALSRYYPSTYYAGLEGQQQATKVGRGRNASKREQRARAALRQHFGYPGQAPRTWWRKLLTWPSALRLRYGRRDVDAIPWAGQGELCDFGCGSCGFLRLQRQRGWTVCGVDFSADAAEWARKRDNLEVQVGTWPGEAMAGRTFDVVTSFHVIEHVPDPVAWVRAAAEKVRPGGYLLICCPIADSWAFRTFGQDWYGLDVPRHLSHFSLAAIRRLVQDAGLTVERVRTQVRAQTLRASAELRGKRTGSILWRLLAKSSLPWRAVALITGWTGSPDGVVVIARKPHALGA